MANDPYDENSFNSHQHVNVEFTVLHQTHKHLMYIKGVGVGCFDDQDPCDDIAIKTQIYSNIFKTMKGE